MEPTNLFADTIEPVLRTKPDELFRIQIEARPMPEAEDAAEFDGAVINCWIDADDLRTAELRAIELIQEEKWTAVRIEDWELGGRDSYSPEDFDEDELTEIFETIDEAFECGASLIFYFFPPDEEGAAEAGH
jgi:hypothetical protein